MLSFINVLSLPVNLNPFRLILIIVSFFWVIREENTELKNKGLAMGILLNSSVDGM